MRELMCVRNFSFTYADESELALSSINLTVQAGDFITLVGATGSGKTTLLRHLKKELEPAGNQEGMITFEGQPLHEVGSMTSAQKIGFVAQNPQIQPIMATVMEELAFPLENLGYSTEAINNRVAELANYLGLDQLLHASISSLSGGQLQLVNLASVLTLKPEMILLDEPTAQLDPTTAQNFLNVLQQLHDDLGITIILTEHRLSRVLGLANRLVVLRAGQIIFNGPVSQGLRKMITVPGLKSFIPPIPRFFLDHQLSHNELPLSIPQGHRILAADHVKFKSQIVQRKTEMGPSVLSAKSLNFHFDSHLILRNLTLNLYRGQWLAIIGKNGSGKSTLLSVLAGLRKPQHGKVYLDGKPIQKIPNIDRVREIAYLSQNPTEQFSENTVWKELEFQNRLNKQPMAQAELESLLAELGLDSVKERDSFDLSGGQQQLLGLGLALVTHPKILILDEPTKGLDPVTKQKIGLVLKRVHQSGTTIMMASHDMDFCAEYANQCTFMFNGTVTRPLDTRLFFSRNFLFTTAINRLLSSQIPDALFSKDVKVVADERR